MCVGCGVVGRCEGVVIAKAIGWLCFAVMGAAFALIGMKVSQWSKGEQAVAKARVSARRKQRVSAGDVRVSRPVDWGFTSKPLPSEHRSRVVIKGFASDEDLHEYACAVAAINVDAMARYRTPFVGDA